MGIEFVVCPVCKQMLGLQDYMLIGTAVVCVNCETNLRVEKRKPLRVARVPVEETFNSDDRPESYG